MGKEYRLKLIIKKDIFDEISAKCKEIVINGINEFYTPRNIGRDVQTYLNNVKSVTFYNYQLRDIGDSIGHMLIMGFETTPIDCGWNPSEDSASIYPLHVTLPNSDPETTITQMATLPFVVEDYSKLEILLPYRSESFIIDLNVLHSLGAVKKVTYEKLNYTLRDNIKDRDEYIDDYIDKHVMMSSIDYVLNKFFNLERIYEVATSFPSEVAEIDNIMSNNSNIIEIFNLINDGASKFEEFTKNYSHNNFRKSEIIRKLFELVNEVLEDITGNRIRLVYNNNDIAISKSEVVSMSHMR